MQVLFVGHKPLRFRYGSTSLSIESISQNLLKFNTLPPNFGYFNTVLNEPKGQGVACSGAGTQSIYLAKKGFKVTGIEISKTACEIAERRSKRAGAKCCFLNGDVLAFPFKRDEFDFIVDRGCFHHIPKERRRDLCGEGDFIFERG